MASSEQRLRNLGIPDNLPPEETKRLLAERIAELEQQMAEEEAEYRAKNPPSS